MLARLQQLKELSKAKRQVSQSLDNSIYLFIFRLVWSCGIYLPKASRPFLLSQLGLLTPLELAHPGGLLSRPQKDGDTADGCEIRFSRH